MQNLASRQPRKSPVYQPASQPRKNPVRLNDDACGFRRLRLTREPAAPVSRSGLSRLSSATDRGPWRPTRLAWAGGRRTRQPTPQCSGPFSAASKPNFASKYSFESSRRDLNNTLLCTPLKPHFCQKNSRIKNHFLQTFLTSSSDMQTSVDFANF